MPSVLLRVHVCFGVARQGRHYALNNDKNSRIRTFPVMVVFVAYWQQLIPVAFLVALSFLNQSAFLIDTLLLSLWMCYASLSMLGIRINRNMMIVGSDLSRYHSEDV